MDLNQPVPDFALPDLKGNLHRLSDYHRRIVVVNFWSAECPWSERADAHLMAVMRQLMDRVSVLTIASNVNESSEMINDAAQKRKLELVLRDSGEGGVCDLFGAQTTPHAFVIDPGGILRYRGAVDDVTFRKRKAERWYVEEAVEAVLDGRIPEIQETAPYGCTIVREV